MKPIDSMRPSDLHDKALRLRERDGREFSSTKAHGFVQVPCPACGAGDYLPEPFSKYGFRHLTCVGCGTMYVSPRPTEPDLFEYYTRYEAAGFWTQVLIGTNHDRKHLQYSPRAEFLASIASKTAAPRGIAVDLGAGNGNFARALRDSGFYQNVIAVDVTDACVTACLDQGLDARRGSLDLFEDASLSCITMNDLIEHVFDARAMLAQCYEKLAPGGLLLVATPNGRGFDFLLAGEETVNIAPPEHLQFFNPDSIALVMNAVGLSPVQVTTPGILDVQIVRRMVAEKKLVTLPDRFVSYLISRNDPELDDAFQRFLAQNCLSSHMVAIGRKPD